MLINVYIIFRYNFSAYLLRWIPPCGKNADCQQISPDCYAKTFHVRASLLNLKFLSSKIFNCGEQDLRIQSEHFKKIHIKSNLSLTPPPSLFVVCKKRVVRIMLVLIRLHSLNIFAFGENFCAWTFWLTVLEPRILLFIWIQIIPPKKKQKVDSE